MSRAKEKKKKKKMVFIVVVGGFIHMFISDGFGYFIHI